jgi:uncharacterized protein (TIGR03067 family)
VGLLVAAAPPSDQVAKDLKNLEGTWVLVSASRDGKELSEAERKKTKITFAGNKYDFPDEAGISTSQKGVIKIDPTKSPKWMDSRSTSAADKGKVSLGIYELKGDDYKVCFAPPGKKRPKTFSAKPGSGRILQVWKRETSQKDK